MGRRFYIICEAEGSFRAISAGHGGGRDLDGVADFANGRRCVKNFGNAMDSDLTAGGAYVTGETTASFKGYYRAAGGDAVFERAFLKFDGEGETANARERAIGGHPAVLLRGVCRRKDPSSPHADPDGYVPFGKLVNYVAGRSDGCTSWSASDAATIMAMVKNDPTTLYIYPESRDIDAVARAVRGRRGAVARGALLERRVPERHRRAEILAEGNARADPCAMARGASRSAAAAAADLQGALSGYGGACSRLWQCQRSALRTEPAGDRRGYRDRHLPGPSASQFIGRDPMTVQFISIVPILRIFDVAKADEFYQGFLGFKVDWDHRFDDNAPLDRQVSRGDLILHLSEHHGDGSPGARLRVMMRGVEEFHREISAKNYRYMRPGLEKTPWGTLETGAIDPFGTIIRFCERIDER